MIIQGHCGSSYAFSTVGAIEGAWSIKYGHLVNISAQNIIDCSGAILLAYKVASVCSHVQLLYCWYMTGHFGNRGCNGGNMKNSFRYVISNKGINSAMYYPYRARVRCLWRSWRFICYLCVFVLQKLSCKYNTSHSVAHINGSVNLAAGNESQLQMAVANVGPISVAVDASSRTFRVGNKHTYKHTSLSCVFNS